MSTHSAECSPHTCFKIETLKRAPSTDAACGRTLIRKTSLLRKIEPVMRRSSFTNKDAAQLRTSCDAEALIVPEIVYVTRELLRGSHTRIDLLYTMSEIPHPHPEGRKVRSDVSRTANWVRRSTVSPSSPFGLCRARFDCLRLAAPRVAKGEAWWSQTGSNRRPHACKARALPAELWPRTRRRMLSLRPSSPFGLCRARSLRLAWLRHA
jgi:hypothetical protein